MADTRAVLSTILYCLWYPTTKLLQLLVTILSPIWAIAQFILLPVTYLIQGLLAIILFPLRLHILERIEVCRISIFVMNLIVAKKDVEGGAEAVE